MKKNAILSAYFADIGRKARGVKKTLSDAERARRSAALAERNRDNRITLSKRFVAAVKAGAPVAALCAKFNLSRHQVRHRIASIGKAGAR